jgi:hypothetical protein
VHERGWRSDGARQLLRAASAGSEHRRSSGAPELGRLVPVVGHGELQFADDFVCDGHIAVRGVRIGAEFFVRFAHEPLELPLLDTSLFDSSCSRRCQNRRHRIKRLVRNATETPLAQGLALERNLFLKLCITEPALARMRSYEEENITSPSRSIVVETRSVNHG